MGETALNLCYKYCRTDQINKVLILLGSHCEKKYTECGKAIKNPVGLDWNWKIGNIYIFLALSAKRV